MKRAFLYTGLLALVALIVFSGSRTNKELGLTQFDTILGGPVDVKVLKAKTKSAADGYFPQIQSQLRAFCRDDYTLTPDATKASAIRAWGYRSSFYYYCWDIYLPFVLKTARGQVYLLVAQLSDGTPGNMHDLEKFHVLRVYLLDPLGHRLEQIEAKPAA